MEKTTEKKHDYIKYLYSAPQVTSFFPDDSMGPLKGAGKRFGGFYCWRGDTFIVATGFSNVNKRLSRNSHLSAHFHLLA